MTSSIYITHIIIHPYLTSPLYRVSSIPLSTSPSIHNKLHILFHITLHPHHITTLPTSPSIQQHPHLYHQCHTLYFTHHPHHFYPQPSSPHHPPMQPDLLLCSLLSLHSISHLITRYPHIFIAHYIAYVLLSGKSINRAILH